MVRNGVRFETGADRLSDERKRTVVLWFLQGVSIEDISTRTLVSRHGIEALIRAAVHQLVALKTPAEGVLRDPAMPAREAVAGDPAEPVAIATQE